MAEKVKLTSEQVKGLEFFKKSNANGPAPGWNADVELEIAPGKFIDGADLHELFKIGAIVANPVPPPHTEDFDEDSGSIVRDHEWSITPLGLSLIGGPE